MTTPTFTFQATIWLYQGESPWHFVTIEKGLASEIKMFDDTPRRGFGSIPVLVSIGKTQWKTSIFPEKAGTYLLPIKKDVRLKEDLKAGDTIALNLELLL